MQDDRNLFFAIKSVDVEQRLVFGRATEETLDRQGEVLDYALSKPYWEAWISETQAASAGKSMGNLRAMHRADNAIGKLVRVDFNDADKSIDVVAKVVDDAEWAKVQEGVYTGFSQGGKYISKCSDPAIKGPGGMPAIRVVIAPKELSLVDRPCVPTATFFEVVKADGTTENRNFKGESMAEEVTATKGIWEGKAMLSAIQELKSIHDYIGEGGIGAELEEQIRELGKLTLEYIAEELGEHIGLTVDDGMDIDSLIGKAEDTDMDTNDDGEPIEGAKGDFPGHPFRGNQHRKGGGSGAHHGASRSAHLASVRAHSTGGASAHRAAANYHKTAASAHAKAGNAKMTAHHKEKAAYHSGTAGRFAAGGQKSEGASEAEKAANNGRIKARAMLCDAHKAYMDTYNPGESAKSEGEAEATKAEAKPLAVLISAAVAEALNARDLAQAEAAKRDPAPEATNRPRLFVADKGEDAFDARKAASVATDPVDAIKIARQNPALFPVL